MRSVKVWMFGELRVQFDGMECQWTKPCKMHEVFCYLLTHRMLLHQREHLAETLWCDSPASTARKNLRQTLWQLQSYFAAQLQNPQFHLLVAGSESIAFHPEIDLWTDVMVFEQSGKLAQGATEIDESRAHKLRQAVQLYQGDLLGGWYQDWCLYERERLQHLYFKMLGKLMAYCEMHQQYEEGMSYAEIMLQYDPAGERAHQQLMRLKYLIGDRTGALRQYESCVKALREELGVIPSLPTQQLYEQMRTAQETLLIPSATKIMPKAEPEINDAQLHSPGELLAHLRAFQSTINDLQHQAQQWIQIVERLDSEQRLNG